VIFCTFGTISYLILPCKLNWIILSSPFYKGQSRGTGVSHLVKVICKSQDKTSFLISRLSLSFRIPLYSFHCNNTYERRSHLNLVVNKGWWELLSLVTQATNKIYSTKLSIPNILYYNKEKLFFFLVLIYFPYNCVARTFFSTTPIPPPSSPLFCYHN